MKALLIGIDGGDERILDLFSNDFYKQLKTDSALIPIEEDLMGRGWAKLVTGTDEKESGAFYMGPKLDGSNQFASKFSLTKCLSDNGIDPIWQPALNAGHCVGVMNLPTVSQATEIDGFMVGSAGGGLFKLDGIPESLVHPKSLKDHLEKAGYTPDIRINSSNHENLEDLFKNLIRMERKRAEAFVELCKEHSVEFGLLVDRATTVVQFLARGDIEQLILEKKGETPDWKVSERIRALVENYYKEMDQTLRYIVESLNPEHLIITADHGHDPYTHRGNLNAFLNQFNYLTKHSSLERVLYRTLSKLKLTIPNFLKSVGYGYNPKKTKAFGFRNVDGIYINDKKRFGGPVETTEISQLVDNICNTFNATQEAKTHKLKAEPYRANYPSSKYYDNLPDIKISRPDSLFFDSTGPSFVRKNGNYGPTPELDKVLEDMFSGQKSRNPIFLVDTKTAALVEDSDPRDLTLGYRLVQRVFSASSEHKD